jgi:hypothetical protein
MFEPSACISVDLYWKREHDVVFVQILSPVVMPSRPIGHYVRLARSGFVDVMVIVPEDILDSSVVLQGLREIAARPFDRKRLGDSLEPLLSAHTA